MEFVQENWQMIVVALLGLSEVLAMIPVIKSNSIFQLVVNTLMVFKPKSSAEKALAKEAKKK